MKKKNLLDYSLNEIQKLVIELDQPKFRAKQIYSWLHQGIYSFDEMTNLPKLLRSKLDDNYTTGILKIKEKHKSGDHSIKFLIELADDNLIECILMKQKYGNTICISTQVGCAMGCLFCASCKNGFIRNLIAGEMLGQVLTVNKYLEQASGEQGRHIKNVVLMGIGEPLQNYTETISFLKAVNSEDGFNMGMRNITISTCGLPTKIKRLADENMQVSLSLSLHAPNDNIRKKIMPIAKSYTIKETLKACEYYFEKTGRRVTIEYIMINNVNDSMRCALELALLLENKGMHINLIPFNTIDEVDFKPSSEERIEAFSAELRRHNCSVTIRKSSGGEVTGACGQLRNHNTKR